MEYISPWPDEEGEGQRDPELSPDVEAAVQRLSSMLSLTAIQAAAEAAERNGLEWRKEEGVWCDVDDIAVTTGFGVKAVRAFVEKYRYKIGNEFQASMEKNSIYGDGVTEHFSPQCTAWIIASLQAAWERYQERLANQPPQSHRQDAS